MELSQIFSQVTGKLTGNGGGAEKMLAVKISATSVDSTVWTVENGQVVVGKVASAPISKDGFDELLSVADQSISQAASGDDQIFKVVFAVPDSWVDSGKILPEKLELLRRLCKELDLSPSGFVILTEALENYFKELEGAPLTAILVGIDGKEGFMTMYRAGKKLGTASFPLKSLDDIVPEVEKELKNLTAVEVLPSRIIIYDSDSNLETVAQQISAHHWNSQLPFLHLPKVEIVSAPILVKAVATAAGVQMGGKISLDQEQAAEPVSHPSAPIVPQEGEPETPTTSEVEQVDASQAGFLSESSLDEMQFPVAKSAAAAGEKNPIAQEIEKDLGQLKEIISEKEEELKPLASNIGLSKFSWNKIAAFPKKLFSNILHSVSFLGKIFAPKIGSDAGQVHAGNKKLTFAKLGLIFLVFIVAILAILYFVPKATVIVQITPVIFDHEKQVLVTTSGQSPSSPSADLVLSGSFLDVSEVGSKKGVTTGKKLVGDKAHGTVTIYSVSSTKAFPAGTSLTSADGLKFTLDNDANVASGDAVTPATTNAAITAADIGDSFNLTGGTKFTIGNLPSSAYLAKNDSAFTGGNSHQATVVTNDDQSRLLATLSAELVSQANSDLQSKVPSGQTLLPNAATSTISKKKFSKDVDAEAEAITLDLSMDFQGVIFSQQDLINLFAKSFSGDIPSGYSLTPDNSQIDVREAKPDKSGGAFLTVHLLAHLIPQINNASVIQSISGKGSAFATDYLRQLPGVSAITLDVSPRFLEQFVKIILPLKKENIKLELVSQ